jgi:hypothetical protein
MEKNLDTNSSGKSNLGIRRCAEWLAYCIEIGWGKRDLNALEEFWWKSRDKDGNLLSSEQAVQVSDTTKSNSTPEPLPPTPHSKEAEEIERLAKAKADELFTIRFEQDGTVPSSYYEGVKDGYTAAMEAYRSLPVTGEGGQH